MSGPQMTDPHGDIRGGIEGLKPAHDGDDTSIDGRMTSLDHDTYLVYSEIYDLLAAGPPDGGDPREWERQVHDHAGTLAELHQRTEQVFDQQLAVRWGW